MAAINLSIFHAYADRVRMTNIAQMVNVLQAMILTDKEKMVLTPTYHVFHLYKLFRGATSLRVQIAAPARVSGDLTVPTVNASAARGRDGPLHYALVNLDPGSASSVRIEVRGATPRKLTGRVLTAGVMDAVNTFARPETVRPAPFNGALISDGKIAVKLPAKSIVVLSETAP